MIMPTRARPATKAVRSNLAMVSVIDGASGRSGPVAGDQSVWAAAGLEKFPIYFLGLALQMGMPAARFNRVLPEFRRVRDGWR